MPLVVGVTGGIGSGKSAVTERFEQRGICVVDADLASRVVVEPGRPALASIADHFGTGILQADGSLDRAALRKIVFTDESQREWLEQLTHPLIGAELARQLRAADSPYVILSSPLLLETSQHELVDIVAVVDVPEEVQLARAAARDHNDEAQIQRIMAAQIARHKRLEKADIVIDNTGSLAALDKQVEALHRQFELAAAGAD